MEGSLAPQARSDSPHSKVTRRLRAGAWWHQSPFSNMPWGGVDREWGGVEGGKGLRFYFLLRYSVGSAGGGGGGECAD